MICPKCMGNKYIHDEQNELRPCPECLRRVRAKKARIAKENPNLAQAMARDLTDELHRGVE